MKIFAVVIFLFSSFLSFSQKGLKIHLEECGISVTSAKPVAAYFYDCYSHVSEDGAITLYNGFNAETYTWYELGIKDYEELLLFLNEINCCNEIPEIVLETDSEITVSGNVCDTCNAEILNSIELNTADLVDSLGVLNACLVILKELQQETIDSTASQTELIAEWCDSLGVSQSEITETLNEILDINIALGDSLMLSQDDIVEAINELEFDFPDTLVVEGFDDLLGCFDSLKVTNEALVASNDSLLICLETLKDQGELESENSDSLLVCLDVLKVEAIEQTECLDSLKTILSEELEVTLDDTLLVEIAGGLDSLENCIDSLKVLQGETNEELTDISETLDSIESLLSDTLKVQICIAEGDTLQTFLVSGNTQDTVAHGLLEDILEELQEPTEVDLVDFDTELVFYCDEGITQVAELNYEDNVLVSSDLPEGAVLGLCSPTDTIDYENYSSFICVNGETIERIRSYEDGVLVGTIFEPTIEAPLEFELGKCEFAEIYTEELCFHGFYYQYDNTVNATVNGQGACGTPSSNFGLADYISQWSSFENTSGFDPFGSLPPTDGGGSLNGWFTQMEAELDANTSDNWDWGSDGGQFKCFRFITTIASEQAYGKWEIIDNGKTIEIVPRVRYAKCELTKKVCETKGADGITIEETTYLDGEGNEITDFRQWIIDCTGWEASSVNNVFESDQDIIDQLTTDCAYRGVEEIESNCETGTELVCANEDGSGESLTLFWSICEGVYSQELITTATVDLDPTEWIEYSGEFAYCDGSQFEQPTNEGCDKPLFTNEFTYDVEGECYTRKTPVCIDENGVKTQLEDCCYDALGIQVECPVFCEQSDNFDCDNIETGNFDPDRGASHNIVNGSGQDWTLTSTTGVGNAFIGTFLNGGGQCEGTAQVIVAHVHDVNNQANQGWILIDRANTSGNDFTVGNVSSCSPAQIIEVLGSLGLNGTTTNALVTTGSFSTGGAGPLVSGANLNGDFEGGALSAPFGICLTIPSADGEECPEGSIAYVPCEDDQLEENCTSSLTGAEVCGIVGTEKEQRYATMWVLQNPCTGELTYQDCDTEEIITEFEKISCECDVTSTTITACEYVEGNCVRTFDRHILDISNCPDEKREETDYESGTNTILDPAITGEVENCIDCDNPLTQRCYVCEPKPQVSTVKPIKAQAAKSEIRLVKLKALKSERTLTKKEASELKALMKFTEASSKDCVHGTTVEVMFTDAGTSYEVNGEQGIEFDSTGYSSIPCEVEICEPDMNVKVVNTVDVNSPHGEIKCYGADGNGESQTYNDDDGDRDLTYSIGGSPTSTLMKWNHNGTNSDGNQDFTQSVLDCIDSGEVAKMTITDKLGNVSTFDADAYTGSIQNNNVLFSGQGSSSLSGEIQSVTFVCGEGTTGGEAYYCTTCGEGGTWFDTVTGEVVENDALFDCIPEADCDIEIIEGVGCLTEDVDGVGVQDDPVLFFIERDCNGVVSNSNYTTPAGVEVDPNFVSTECASDFDLEEITQCVISRGIIGGANEWTRYILIEDGEIVGEFFVNQETLEVSDDIGGFILCPPESSLVDAEKVCGFYEGEATTGYALFYDDNTSRYSLSADPSDIVSGFREYCCTDCIQIAGCYDPRLTRIVSTTLCDGTIVNTQDLVNDGVATSIQDALETITSIYGGTSAIPTEYSSPQSLLCEGTNLHSIELYNSSACVASYNTATESIDVQQVGDCPERTVAGCTVLDIVSACDDNNEALSVDFIQGITRVIENCSDTGIQTTYYTDFGTATEAEYNLQGTFVGCTDGLPVPEPEAPEPTCPENAWAVVDVFTAVGDLGVNVEVYEATGTAATLASDIFTGAADFSGLPTTTGNLINNYTETDLLALDLNNGQDATRIWTYIYTQVPIRVSEVRGTAETIDYWVDECCSGTATLVETGAYPNNGGNPGEYVTLQPGIHLLGFTIFDLSVWSGIDVRYTTDLTSPNPTFARVPSSWLYKTKPTIQKCPAKVCLTTNVFVDLQTGKELGNVSLCEPDLCTPVAGNDLGSRVDALEEKISRECVQIWAEDSGATAPFTFDYSFGNGNELTTFTNQNWGVPMLYNGEIVAFGFTVDDPVTATQRIAVTLDEAIQASLTLPIGGDEIWQTGYNIPVTQGQVINWLTQAGNADDVVPAAIVCYEID